MMRYYGGDERRGSWLAMEREARRPRRMFQTHRQRWLASAVRITLLVAALAAVIWCGWQVRRCAADWKAAVIEWRWNRAIERAIPAEELERFAPPPIVREEGLPPTVGERFYVVYGPGEHEPADPTYMPH